MEKTTNKKYTITIIAGIILIIVAFFGGKAYGSSHAKPTSGFAMNGAAGFAGRGGMAGGFAGRGGAAGAAGTAGQVVSKDANSITVSIPNGGSKIILYSPTTAIMKSAQGAIGDVAVGSTITATGKTNSDGSITATSIQIRPRLNDSVGQAASNARTTSNPGGPMIPAAAPTAQ